MGEICEHEPVYFDMGDMLGRPTDPDKPIVSFISGIDGKSIGIWACKKCGLVYWEWGEEEDD